MTQIISVFNHKGGVSKTTTAFNIGWMLAKQGSTVILVDADPQCNLTGVALGLETDWASIDDSEEEASMSSELFEEKQESSQDFWTENISKTLFGALRPAFDSEPRVLEAVECIPLSKQPNLYLLPGHLRLGEYEVQLGIAQELATSMNALRNLPGAIYYLLERTSEKLEADYVIIDMSPSLGSLNQNLVCISDSLIIPSAPDFFSIMSLQSLARVLPRWIKWARQAAQSETLAEAAYPFPAPRLKVLGEVIQRFRLYKSPTADLPDGVPTSPFQAWIDRVTAATTEYLLPALKKADLLYDEDNYERVGIDPQTLIISRIPEFNSLLPKSQEHQVPVYELTQEMLGQSGVVLENSMARVTHVERIFAGIAAAINQVCGSHS
ncbi:AAA family ATPase [Tsukamurella tyrosinosolvens]|uniref:ParA family protein n=1 Tax=Tsukamurella tyrosinosolvens TaxID=57704 RepID=UPI001AFC4AE5|nr:AAA family ATPase [Tsukamurella tyrosinosolvens]QRY83755.1 AAA family ATPase [Tsukamurella tyrosinosolvens]